MDSMANNAGTPLAERGAAGALRAPRIGLQSRFTILVVCLTLAVATLVGVLVVNLVGQLTSRQTRQQTLELSTLLAKAAAEPLAQNDVTTLDRLTSDFSTGDPILFAAITDPHGVPIAATETSGVHSAEHVPLDYLLDLTVILGSPTFVDHTGEVEPHLQVAYPIASANPKSGTDSELLGYVWLGVNVQRTLQDLEAAVDLFSGVSVAVLALTVPLAFLLVRCIVVPIKEVSRAVGRFAEGDLKARSAVHRGDEIGQLANAYNKMADELEAKHRQIVALNADLEERVRARTRQLRELAAREPLTGLYNRRHFNEVLAQRAAEASRYGFALSCMMIDLDDFKKVNDAFGHQVGDEVLTLAATSIASQLRAADVAARFGGDEFIVLLPQTPADRAAVLAERIAEKFAMDLAEKCPQVQVTLSIGIASVTDATPDVPEALVRSADKAMYQAKDSGKSGIVAAPVPAEY